jgi:hypothetical protein
MSNPSFTRDEILELWEHLTPDEQAEIMSLFDQMPIWTPIAGVQTQAYLSKATITGYGGAAGGGKTDLAVGLALTEHQRVMIVRDEAKQLKGITDRIIEIVGHRKGFNSVGGSWTNPVPNCLIDLLGIPNIGDETKMQGVPHDLIVFDETANLRESQVRFLMGWLRSADPKQRKRVLMTFNPPTTAEGRWVIDYFKPWLDKNYEPKAKSGELRACYVVEGKDYWLPTLNTDPFVLVDGEPCYDFDHVTSA